MTRSRPSHGTAIRQPAWWILLGFGLLVGVLLSLSWPINYDESFNYLYFADRGPAFVVTNYPYPNNHILFTLIQTALPRGLVEANPLLLRVPNLVVTAGLVATLAWDRDRPWASAWSAGAIALSAPFLVQYFGQARGFNLGTLLVALSFLAAVRWADSRWGWLIAAGLMALAVWSVPTFAYGAPVLAGYYLMRRDIASAVAFSASFVGMSLFLYWPVLGQLSNASEFSDFRPLGEYSFDVISEVFFLPLALVLVVLAIVVWAWYRSFHKIGNDSKAGLTFLFLGYPVVFLVVAETATALGVSASPFVRNALFLPAFAIVGLVSSDLWKAGFWRWAIVALMVFNAFLGLIWLQTMLDGSGIVSFRGTAFGQTPRLEPLLEGDPAVEELECAWTDEWTCRLYEPKFADHGISMSYPVPDLPTLACVMGRHPPRPGTGIAVLNQDGTRGLVCYGPDADSAGMTS